MFNDVHVAKVSKINKTVEWTKGTAQNSSLQDAYKSPVLQLNIAQRTSESFESFKDDKDAKRHLRELGLIFGSTSPTCGPIEVEPLALDKHRNMRSTSLLYSGESADCLLKENNESDNNISSCSTLDIVNKVENLTLLELETHLKEISQRLRNAEKQRDELRRELDECTEEKELCYRRLEVISASHESRITEMHCVIAELSKKLRTRQETTILEENEPEGSEISYQEESVCNSELNYTNPDAEGQLNTFDQNYSIGDASEKERLFADTVGKDLQNYNDSIVKSRAEALQEEVLHLKAQIALLQSEIAEGSKHLTQEPSMGFIVQGHANIQYFDGDVETDATNSNMQPRNRGNVIFDETEKSTCGKVSVSQCVSTPQAATLFIPKMAEKIKLRHSTEPYYDNTTTVDLLNCDISHSQLVGSFVSDFLQNSKMKEQHTDSSDLNEFQQLQREIDQLKIQNVMLSLTLGECKEHCEQLYLLCGKYESNAIALQSAVNCSDRAIEAYDVMLALLESKIAFMNEKTEAAGESRKAVESVARNLMVRLDSEKNLNENSLGPWKNTFNFTDKTCTPWTAEDDNRLRYHVSKLKGRRSTVQNTIVNLESPFSACYEKSRLALEGCKEFNLEKDIQVDIETAVLMQELLNLREENIKLKAKAAEAEHDRQFAMDKINILQEDLQQLQMQLAVDSDALFNLELTAEDREFFSESKHAALTERQLVEALTRESELKGRIQALLATVSASRKNSNEQYVEVQNNIKDLQKINIDLTQALEGNKRKYQTRIRKLEQKIAEMNAELLYHRDIQKPHNDPPTVRKSKVNLLTVDNVPETIL